VEHREALAAAMTILQPASALILDMRNNGGGSPGTVALLMSYLFEEPGTPLFEIIPRNGAREIYATVTDPLPWRDGKRPVFVLTSKNSFSGGEGLAFLLQDLKRAIVVGEPTAGAANPGRPYPVNEQFEVTVPNGLLLSVVSRRNWEGNGVLPMSTCPPRFTGPSPRARGVSVDGWHRHCFESPDAVRRAPSCPQDPRPYSGRRQSRLGHEPGHDAVDGARHAYARMVKQRGHC
jgi:hypothetical protein